MTASRLLPSTGFQNERLPQSRTVEPEARSLLEHDRHPTLRLVNERVVFQRQVLRLVIDKEEEAGAHNGISARDAELLLRRAHESNPPIAGSGPTRLTAARVGVHPVPGIAPPGLSPRGVTPAGEVRREMMSASSLPAEDARMILARRTAESLEGGRLARLAPGRRAGLERLASRLGLRAFDTNLVIAIAQDAARNGEGIGPASERLQLVGGAREAAVIAWGWSVLAAVGVAALILLALVRWVQGS